jgi:hypothetical protein
MVAADPDGAPTALGKSLPRVPEGGFGDCEGGLAGSSVLGWRSVAAGVALLGTGFVPGK